jgi:glycosyltransferase involved in cell wall biosynthesis
VLLARARARLVTVHHTKEADEILSAGPAIGPRARAWMERVQSPRILSRVAGIVGVTDEIRDFQLEKVKRPKPAVTVSNGVDVERVSPTGFVPLRASRHALEMIFVASAHLPWHGTDRLLASLAAYRGQRRVRLHLVGSAPGAARPPANDRVEVVYHGVLRGEALDDVFRRATLAVSSLAMFRNGMRQGSPLKTREYVARGIPFVYGYDGADVPGGVPFALQVPNSGALVDMDRIVEFAERVSSRPGTSAEMRSFAMARLDWSVKLAQLRRFAESVA